MILTLRLIIEKLQQFMKDLKSPPIYVDRSKHREHHISVEDKKGRSWLVKLESNTKR